MTHTDPIFELEQAIKDAGTQTRFADQSGFSQAYISAVIRKERPPSERLLAYLGLKSVIVRDGGAK